MIDSENRRRKRHQDILEGISNYTHAKKCVSTLQAHPMSIQAENSFLKAPYTSWNNTKKIRSNFAKICSVTYRRTLWNQKDKPCWFQNRRAKQRHQEIGNRTQKKEVEYLQLANFTSDPKEWWKKSIEVKIASLHSTTFWNLIDIEMRETFQHTTLNDGYATTSALDRHWHTWNMTEKNKVSRRAVWSRQDSSDWIY